MNVFKLRTLESAHYPIILNTYGRLISRVYSWYQTDSEWIQYHFAVCPACDNPIQIIHFYKKLKNTGNPYEQNINSMGTYSHNAYLWCPYSKKK